MTTSGWISPFSHAAEAHMDPSLAQALEGLSAVQLERHFGDVLVDAATIPYAKTFGWPSAKR